MSDILEELKELEIELHQPKCRRDANRLSELLHDSFLEFGRSGRVYSKQEIIDSLSNELGNANVISGNYAIQSSCGDMVIVTYKSAHKKKSGEFINHTNRSSVWVKENGAWLLKFHQGTPTSDFSVRSI